MLSVMLLSANRRRLPSRFAGTKSIVIEDVVRGDAGYIIVPMVIENLLQPNDIEEYKSNCK